MKTPPVFALTLVSAVSALVACNWRGGPAPADGEPTPRTTPAPEFTGVTEWVNSPPLRMADLKGKVVVVHFWTNGCVNCVHNYPHYRAWQERYQGDPNLVIVGTHTPEFDAEKDVTRMKDRMARNGLTFAVAVDNGRANWEAWGVEAWPSIFLVDKAGNVRHRWEGELRANGYTTTTARIDGLLRE